MRREGKKYCYKNMHLKEDCSKKSLLVQQYGEDRVPHKLQISAGSEWRFYQREKLER